MDEIQLPLGVWRYDERQPLGSPGGFGAVFRGEDSAGNPVAVKRLKLSAEDAAHRELAVAEELKELVSRHVMPVLDSGQDPGSGRYFIVMPVADCSLQDVLDAEGHLSEADALAVLDQIAEGLADSADFVHRDLKPANVLRLDDTWRIADFGIARFAEASTSTETLKGFLSDAYAAPEQWRGERASRATDIYALGCIAHALVTGAPPFSGSRPEVREAHLSRKPDRLTGVAPQLSTVTSMMLRKTPESRPSVDRVRSLIEAARSGFGVAASAVAGLAAAVERHEDRLSTEEARLAELKAAVDARRAVAREAAEILDECFDELARRITAAVPAARVESTDLTRRIEVAGANIVLWPSGTPVPTDAFPRSGWDVITGSVIEVNCISGSRRAASLWYTRQKWPNQDPRWYEVGYKGNALSSRRFEHEPSEADYDLADRAHSNAMDTVVTAYPPTPIDDENLEEFCERWTLLLTAAADGRLSQVPSSLPTA